PNTTVRRGNEEEPWSFLLSTTGAYIPVLETRAPVGVTLDVGNDGRLVRIGSGHGQTIVVRGVPLNSKNFELQGEVVVSELADAFGVAGETWPPAPRCELIFQPELRRFLLRNESGRWLRRGRADFKAKPFQLWQGATMRSIAFGLLL